MKKENILIRFSTTIQIVLITPHFYTFGRQNKTKLFVKKQ